MRRGYTAAAAECHDGDVQYQVMTSMVMFYDWHCGVHVTMTVIAQDHDDNTVLPLDVHATTCLEVWLFGNIGAGSGCVVAEVRFGILVGEYTWSVAVQGIK